MSTQGSLFSLAGAAAADLEPRGFRYREDIVTKSEEASLVAALQQLELKPFDFHGHLANRRVISFGLQYDYTRRAVERAGDLPPFLGELLARVAEFAGYDVDAFRQVGVNEYSPGAGIGWHKDKPQFGVVVGVSLLAPATLRFRRRHGIQWVRITHTVQPRSIYVLADEARMQWNSIPAMDALRYSITFRTLAEGFELDESNSRNSTHGRLISDNKDRESYFTASLIQCTL